MKMLSSKGQMLKNHIFTGLAIFACLLILIVGFQNCGSKANSSAGQSIKNGTGNGTGFGGKPTITYYQTDTSQTCTPKGSTTPTFIKNIIGFFAENNSYALYSGCDLENPQAITLAQLDISSASNQFLGFKTNNGIFEAYLVPPTINTLNPAIEALCFYFEADVLTTGIAEIQTISRIPAPGSTNSPTIINYSKYISLLNLEIESFTLPEFLSVRTEAVTTVNFNNVVNPSFDLTLSALDPISGLADGQLSVEIEGTVITGAPLCYIQQDFSSLLQ